MRRASRNRKREVGRKSMTVREGFCLGPRPPPAHKSVRVGNPCDRLRWPRGSKDAREAPARTRDVVLGVRVELATVPIRMVLRTVLALQADHLQGLTA